MCKSLNIAMLSIHSCPWNKPGGRYTGGMNIYIQHISRRLADKGHNVDIYTLGHINPLHDKVTQINDKIRLIHLDSMQDNFTAGIHENGHIHRLTNEIITLAANMKCSYDIIHSHYWLSGLIGEQLKETWHIPHCVMFHTLGAVKNEAGLGKIEPIGRINCERQIVSSVDRIISSTVKGKYDLINKYSASANKIGVIPCGVDLNEFRPVEKLAARKICGLDSKIIILFVGRADPLKGLNNLLDATLLLQDRNDYELLIIGGDDTHDSYINSLLKHLPVDHSNNSIKFVGPLSHNQMHLYYNAADYCVIPSYHESFSMIALESLACGTPVLATDVGEIHNLISASPESRIVPDNSPRTLANHIADALDNSAKKESNLRQQEIYFKKYSWDHIVDQLITEYQNLLRETSLCKCGIK